MAQASVVKLEASVKDFKGNTSEFRFYIEGNEPLSPEKKSIKLDWEKDHDLTFGAIQIHLPAGALYKTSEFNLLKKGDAQYVIGEGCVPLQTYMTLEWTLDSTQIPGVGWFLWEADRTGKKSAISGERDGAVMTFKTRSTGTYSLDQDLKKPEVSLLKTTTYPRGNSAFREIRLRVADDKTGVERYSARIDDRFARIDFDYKKEMLKIIVPKDIPAGSHNLRVVVIDGVGNTSVEEYTITL